MKGRLIQITVEVSTLDDDSEAREFGENLAEHVLATFNDDDSLTKVWFKVLPKRKRRI